MRTFRDARDMVVSTWVVTNDAGATWLDPTGGGTPEDNMVVFIENEYDGGMAGGDGNLTQVTQHVDSSTARVTEFASDTVAAQGQIKSRRLFSPSGSRLANGSP